MTEPDLAMSFAEIVASTIVLLLLPLALAAGHRAWLWAVWAVRSGWLAQIPDHVRRRHLS